VTFAGHYYTYSHPACDTPTGTRAHPSVRLFSLPTRHVPCAASSAAPTPMPIPILNPRCAPPAASAPYSAIPFSAASDLSVPSWRHDDSALLAPCTPEQGPPLRSLITRSLCAEF
jgi:hypothetical protein